MSDVAAKAGVGIGTVSRVLSGSHQVSAKTRARVLAAVEELGYSPARSGAKQGAEQGGLVGVVIPDFGSPSSMARLVGVVAALRTRAFHVVIHPVHTPDEARQSLVELPRNKGLDGLIVMSLPLRGDEGERLAGSRFPVVLLDTWHPGLTRVTIDDVAGGRLATQHLIDLGHERVAFVGEPLRNPMSFMTSGLREEGFRDALHKAGIERNAKYVRHGPHLRSAGRQMGTELLALSTPPTAVVAASDTQAVGVMEAARASGRTIPQDLSVIGYDDIDLASLVGLTTIRQPLETSGVRAAEILLTALESGQKPQPFNDVLSLELVQRQSTAAPRP
jgi:DNA-binding LacI/PurR family transcriptional regulator